MNIAYNVERGRRFFPDKTALIFEDETITYKELDERASRVACGLRDLGIERGDRVALFLPNLARWAFFYLGIQKIGAIAVSVNASLKAEELKFILDDSGAKAIVTTETLRHNVPDTELPALKRRLIAEGKSGGDISFVELIAAASPEFEAVEMRRDDPAAIVYTSGTTGFAKGAVLSHGNVTSNMEAKKRYLDIRPDDRMILFLPLFHCFGQNAIFNSGLGAGATIVLHRQFDPVKVMRSIIDDAVTMFFGIPTSFIILCDKASANDMRSVRYYFSAAAILPAEIENRWHKKFGAVIHQGYGLTETSPFASYNHHLKHKPGSVGTPIENVQMKILDVDDGRELAPGATGEIVIRGPNVMLGYWNRPAETAQVIKDGWFHTGDIGRMDDEGYFYIEDRLKDMINVGGLKVYPAEVENLIYQHPAVAEVAVFGVPDNLMGEQVAASIVLKPDQNTTSEEIVSLCRSRAAGFKVPSSIDFVDSIPKNPTGKVLKRVLRGQKSGSQVEQPASAIPQSPPVSNACSIQNWIADWLAKEMAIDSGQIKPDASFFDYGLDSVAVVKLTRELGQWLGRSVQAPIAWSFPTIESLARNLADGPSQQAARLPARVEQKAESHNSDDAGTPSKDLKSLSEAEIAELLDAEIAAAKQRKAK